MVRDESWPTKLKLMMRAPMARAYSTAAATSLVLPSPRPFNTRKDIIFARQDTPAMPAPLLPRAATTPATTVP